MRPGAIWLACARPVSHQSIATLARVGCSAVQACAGDLDMAVTRGLQGMPTVNHCERKEMTPVTATVKTKPCTQIFWYHVFRLSWFYKCQCDRQNLGLLLCVSVYLATYLIMYLAIKGMRWPHSQATFLSGKKLEVLFMDMAERKIWEWPGNKAMEKRSLLNWSLAFKVENAETPLKWLILSVICKGSSLILTCNYYRQ